VNRVGDSLSLNEPLRLPVGQITIDPSRKRSLSKTEFNRLKQSISTDGLLTPISVEKAPDFSALTPKYIIVSGHNRYQALVELGSADVPVSLINIQGQSDRAAFISNLLQPELGIAEIFAGLKILQKAGGERKTNRDIGKETGFSEAYISQVLQMERLPSSIIVAMKENRVRIGSNILKKFISSFSGPEVSPDRIQIALNTLEQRGLELIDATTGDPAEIGTIDQINNFWQKALTTLIKDLGEQKKETPLKKRTLDLKNWDITRASIRGNTVTLEFSSEEEARQLVDLIQKIE
jgi:ParB/RepB/Spo0J family partition protein